MANVHVMVATELNWTENAVEKH